MREREREREDEDDDLLVMAVDCFVLRLMMLSCCGGR